MGSVATCLGSGLLALRADVPGTAAPRASPPPPPAQAHPTLTPPGFVELPCRGGTYRSRVRAVYSRGVVGV